jgi:hypothetical protein
MTRKDYQKLATILGDMYRMASKENKSSIRDYINGVISELAKTEPNFNTAKFVYWLDVASVK